VHGARWLGVLGGFVGVLVILRPGLVEPNPGALIDARRGAADRRLEPGRQGRRRARHARARSFSGRRCSPRSVFAPFGLWFWQDSRRSTLALAFLAGFFGTLGYFLMTWAFRLLDISRAAAARVPRIVWASLFDLVVFGPHRRCMDLRGRSDRRRGEQRDRPPGGLPADRLATATSSARGGCCPPSALFGLFDDRNVEVDDHRLLAAAHKHARERLVVVRVDLLVRNVRRHVDEVARPASATNSSWSPQRMRALPLTT
jgi:hypothetical protein